MPKPVSPTHSKTLSVKHKQAAIGQTTKSHQTSCWSSNLTRTLAAAERSHQQRKQHSSHNNNRSSTQKPPQPHYQTNNTFISNPNRILTDALEREREIERERGGLLELIKMQYNEQLLDLSCLNFVWIMQLSWFQTFYSIFLV